MTSESGLKTSTPPKSTPTQREATLAFWKLSLAWKGVEPFCFNYSSGMFITELGDIYRRLAPRYDVSQQAYTLAMEVVKGRHRRKALSRKRNNVTYLRIPPKLIVVDSMTALTEALA